MAPDAGKKKRRGLGGFLSSKTTNETANDQPPAVPPKDTHVTASGENTHIRPIVNDGKLPDVDAQRNLAVNEKTGEVLDDDTGEVLTVTTTTTTVTKTETRRSRSPQPPPNGNSNTTVEARKVQQTQQYLDPSSAAQHPNTNNLSQPSSSENISPQTYTSSNTNDTGPQRNDSGQWPLPKDETGPPKTAIENLKSAAAGLYDVRDSLRGTNLNDVRDSLKGQLNTANIPVPRRNPARSSRAQQVPTIKSPVPPNRSPAPPVPPIPAHAGGQSQWQAPWAEPEEEYVQSEGLRKRKSLSTMPATFSPESSGCVEREKSPRLFKGRKLRK